MGIFTGISRLLQRLGTRTEVEEPVPVEEVVYEMPQDTSTCYVLKVRCEVVKFESDGESASKEGKRLRRAHIYEAQDQLSSPDFWWEWLSSTMRDAVEASFPNIPYDSWSYREPQIADISVRLSLNPHHPNSRRFRVTVRWNSTAVSPQALGQAVEWRIGDRMSQYGCGDEEAGWRCFIVPALTKIRGA
jgi:hypothetical protein